MLHSGYNLTQSGVKLTCYRCTILVSCFRSLFLFRFFSPLGKCMRMVNTKTIERLQSVSCIFLLSEKHWIIISVSLINGLDPLKKKGILSCQSHAMQPNRLSLCQSVSMTFHQINCQPHAPTNFDYGAGKSNHINEENITETYPRHTTHIPHHPLRVSVLPAGAKDIIEPY